MVLLKEILYQNKFENKILVVKLLNSLIKNITFNIEEIIIIIIVNQGILFSRI